MGMRLAVALLLKWDERPRTSVIFTTGLPKRKDGGRGVLINSSTLMKNTTFCQVELAVIQVDSWLEWAGKTHPLLEPVAGQTCK